MKEVVMPILTTAILGAVAIKGLKKTAPYLAGAAAIATAYIAHKYSNNQLKKQYQNTTIDFETAKKINGILTQHFSSAIRGNLKTNSLNDLITNITAQALINITNENVSILTTERIFKKNSLDEGNALKNSKEDMEETISQVFDSYFQKKEDNVKADEPTVILHAIKNVCICLINEIDSLANIPGKDAKELLQSTINSLKLFLKNIHESEYLMGKKYKLFLSDRRKTIENVRQKIHSWGSDQKIKQEALSSKVYFEFNKEQAYQLFHSWAVFCVQTLDDEAARKRQVLTLNQIFQGYYSEKVQRKNLGENIKNIIPNETLELILHLDSENNKIKINNKDSLLKRYLRAVSTVDEKKLAKKFGTSKLALNVVGSRYYKKNTKNQEELGTKIQKINHKIIILNFLLLDYVNSLDDYGLSPGISSGTFEFKRLLIEDSIAQIKNDIQNILKRPYYQALKKEFEEEKTTKAVKLMIPPEHQKEISTRHLNNKIDGYNIPKQGPTKCSPFNAWEEVILVMQKIETRYKETLNVVAEKKKKMRKDDSSIHHQSQTVIQDLQALTIQTYITDLSFVAFHNLFEFSKNSTQDKLQSIQFDRGKKTVENCYSLMESQIECLRSLHKKSNEISSCKYKLDLSSFIGQFYKHVQSNNSNRTFIKFYIEKDYKDDNYSADVRSGIMPEVPLKGRFLLNFNAIYSLDDLRVFHNDLQTLIQTYKNTLLKRKSELLDPYYKCFKILETGAKAFLEKYDKNQIGTSILQGEIEDQSKEVKRLQNQIQQMKNNIVDETKKFKIALLQSNTKNTNLTKKIEAIKKEKNKVHQQLQQQKDTLNLHQETIKEYIRKHLQEINEIRMKLDKFSKEANNILNAWQSGQIENNQAELHRKKAAELVKDINEFNLSLIKSLNSLEILTNVFQQDCNETIQELKKQITAAENVVKKLQDIINGLESEITQLKIELHRTYQRIEELENTTKSQKILLDSKNTSLVDHPIISRFDNENKHESEKGTSNFIKNREILLTIDEKNYRKNKKNKTVLKVVCWMEVGLIIAYSIPKNYYLDMKMTNQQVHVLKNSVVVVALAMIGIYLIIDRFPIKHYLAMVNKTFRSFCTHEKKINSLTIDPRINDQFDRF